MSYWQRLGSINELLTLPNVNTSLEDMAINKRVVSFHTYSQFNHIKEICIYQNISGGMYITLQTPSLFSEKLIAAFTPIKKTFDHSSCEINIYTSGSICFNIQVTDMMPRILVQIAAFIKKINNDVSKTFAEQLDTELNGIFKFLTESAEGEYKHLIAEDPLRCVKYPASIYPDENDHSLIELLEYIKFRYEVLNVPPAYLKKLKNYLTSDSNCNELHPITGQSAAYIALSIADPTILELLLLWGANAFHRRNGCYFVSAYEHAYAGHMTSKLELMQAALARLTKPMPTRMRVQTTEMKRQDNVIITHFHFTNMINLKSRLFAGNLISKDELLKISEIQRKIFDYTNQAGRSALAYIHSELAGKDKYVELISHDEKIIGFNIFELVIKPATKTSFLHCRLAVMLDDYRGIGIVPLLSFRIAYAMQLLLDTHIVGVIYYSLNANSYNLAKSYHYPKYHSIQAVNDVKMLTQHFWGPETECVMGDLTAYVEDNLKTQNTSVLSQRNLVNRLFTRHYQNSPSPSDPERSVPVLFYIGYEQTQELSYLCYSLGIDLKAHLLLLSDLIKQCHWMNAKVTDNPSITSLFRNDKMLFWRNEFMGEKAADLNASPKMFSSY